MKFSEKWLRKWVNPAIETQELIAQLTMAGLEVDSHEQAAHAFTGVVVAEVLATEKHPDADKLTVCRVNNGTEELQIVCGAANVRAGLKVPLAQVGAVLAEDFKIKASKLRGVESHGMLCSAEELGLAEQADGLLELDADAPVGQDIRTYLELDDTLIEVDLTPNRGDCLSIAGLAREVGVLNQATVTAPVIDAVAASLEDSLPVALSSPEACPRYLGRVIRNVDVSARSPDWLRESLRRSGIRSIDPVVDVTNYVLLELGQPMHAFDLDVLRGGINVRMARPDESLVLLDGKEVKLKPDTLVIADHDKALAMAGIMGGEASAVTADTRHVFLESAFFHPLAIAGRARAHGLQTDAAHRFERGVDFNLPRKAMERATRLLLDIVGGEAGPVVEGLAPLPTVAPVELCEARITSLLGMAMPASQVEDILGRLGLSQVSREQGSWRFAVPSWRFDISIEEDLIEELARVHGYDKLPVTEPLSRFRLKPQPEARVGLKALRRILTGLGYQEIITYSFVDPKLEEILHDRHGEAMVLANPISQDMSVMRSNLWPGLIKTLKHNQHRQQSRARLFESGLRYQRLDGKIQQTPAIAGLLWGGRFPEQWGVRQESVDFFDLKGDVETLLGASLDLAAFEFRPGQHRALQLGMSAEILRQGRHVGWIGALDPAVQRQLDIPGKVLLFELALDALADGRLPAAVDLSRYPSVRRDLALVVDAELPLDSLLRMLRREAGEHLAELVVFDVYQGERIAKTKKSLALGLTWQHPSRTLGEDEIHAIIDSCIKVLEEQFNAELRK